MWPASVRRACRTGKERRARRWRRQWALFRSPISSLAFLRDTPLRPPIAAGHLAQRRGPGKTCVSQERSKNIVETNDPAKMRSKTPETRGPQVSCSSFF